MNHPAKLTDINDTTVASRIKKGKVTVIVLDGMNGTAWQAEAPEHGKTVIETRKEISQGSNLKSAISYSSTT